MFKIFFFVALVSFGVVKSFLFWDQLGFRVSKIITAASELTGGLFLLFGTFFVILFVVNLAFLKVLCPDSIVFVPLHSLH